MFCVARGWCHQTCVVSSHPPVPRRERAGHIPLGKITLGDNDASRWAVKSGVINWLCYHQEKADETSNAEKENRIIKVYSTGSYSRNVSSRDGCRWQCR